MNDNIQKRNIATVMSYYDCVQHSDSGGMAEFLAPELNYRVYSNSPYAGRYNRQQFIDVLPGFFGRQAGPLRFDIQEITAEEDRVCVFTRGTMPLRDGGKQDNMYHYLFRLRDSKIVEVKEVYAPYSDG